MMVSSIENILDAKTLSLVFENIDTAVFIGNLSRQIVAMNTAAEDLFGYKKRRVNWSKYPSVVCQIIRFQ